MRQYGMVLGFVGAAFAGTECLAESMRGAIPSFTTVSLHSSWAEALLVGFMALHLGVSSTSCTSERKCGDRCLCYIFSLSPLPQPGIA